MLRFPSPSPKLLLTALFFCIYYQLYWLKRVPTEASQSTDVSKSGIVVEKGQPPQPLKPVKPVTVDQSQPPSTPSRSPDYSKTHISYGQGKCMPSFDARLQEQVAVRRESCKKHAPFDTQETWRVALATISTGRPVESYQGAIQTHMLYTAVHDTSLHILCDELAPGAYNKIAYLLYLVHTELLKPPEKRLEWILWIDRDAIILDPCRPLSNILPPRSPEFDKVNFIVDHDEFSMNAGLFLFRPNQDAAQLFSEILSINYYLPNEPLVFAEQSAMEKLLADPRWQEKQTYVPWYWFNSYPAHQNSTEDFIAGNELVPEEWFRARKGTFIAHFAGYPDREKAMLEWLDVIKDLDVWKEGSAKMEVTDEIRRYWESYRKGTLRQSQRSGSPFDREAEEKAAGQNELRQS